VTEAVTEVTTEAIASTEDDPASVPAPSVLAPIVSMERIDLMDVLRGFALIGILFMNVEWFNRPIAELLRVDTTLTGLDHAVAWTIKIFVEGKFYKLFSLLFGMGFAVMLTRAEAKGQPFAAMFARRMGALFLFGMLHLVLLWSGDILHDYAVGGLLLLGWVALLRWRRLRRFDTDRFLRRFSLIAIAFPLVVVSAFGFGYGLFHDPSESRQAWQERQQAEPRIEAMLTEARAGKRDLTEPKKKEKVDLDKLAPAQRIEKRAETHARRRAEHDKDVAGEIRAFKQPSYWVATRFRAEESLSKLANTPFFALFILLPIFLFGFWLIRSGVVRDPEPHLPAYRIVALVGLLFGFIFSVGAYTIIHHPATELVNAFRAVGMMMSLLGQLLMAAGYVASFVLAMQRARLRERLRWLAPMGRMALTNYLMHSVILTTLFYGYGFAQFGRIPRAPQMLLVVAIIAMQALLSRWWLSRFQYGPLEWLWRNITYWRWQPLRLPAPSAEPVTL
jgi:uncharacterized protein